LKPNRSNFWIICQTNSLKSNIFYNYSTFYIIL
jgi:hypothetical protein